MMQLWFNSCGLFTPNLHNGSYIEEKNKEFCQVKKNTESRGVDLKKKYYEIWKKLRELL